jgi:hypothetical protein
VAACQKRGRPACADVSSFIQFLSRFDPPWVLVILADVILCYGAQDIVKAFRGKR